VQAKQTPVDTSDDEFLDSASVLSTELIREHDRLATIARLS
jgi:hypothetical protein